MFCISDMKLNYFLFKVLKSILPLVVNTSRSFPHSWLITDFVTRLTRWVSLVEQELFTHSEHLSSPPVFSRVRVTRSLVLYVCFVDRCLSFCTFSFGHCVVCSSSIYWFWLPLWYLQTLFASSFPRICIPCPHGWGCCEELSLVSAQCTCIFWFYYFHWTAYL